MTLLYPNKTNQTEWHPVFKQALAAFYDDAEERWWKNFAVATG